MNADAPVTTRAIGKPPRFWVAWQSKPTGEKRHGEPTTEAIARTHAECMNRARPYSLHWVEPVETDAEEAAR